MQIIDGDQDYGIHRHDFNRLTAALEPLIDDNADYGFVPFLEKYFVWGQGKGEARSSNPEPIDIPWIGYLHVPFEGPELDWAQNVRPESYMKTNLWQKSLKNCRGLICTTKELANQVRAWLPTIPSSSIPLPTDIWPERVFSFHNFALNPRVAHLGSFWRNNLAIYELQCTAHKAIVLKNKQHEEALESQIAAAQVSIDCDGVEQISYLDNADYDALLSNSVIISLMYGGAANNLVLECLVRSTPLLVNPLPGVVEYLGDSYPLYTSDVSAASRALRDNGRILAAHQYLWDVRCSGQLQRFSYETFLSNFANNDIYRSLIGSP